MAAVMGVEEIIAKKHLQLAQFHNALISFGRYRIQRDRLNNVLVETFINQGIDVNFQIAKSVQPLFRQDPCTGYTMLHLTVVERDLHSVNVLLNHRADFTIKCDKGHTALYKAIEYDGHTPRIYSNQIDWFEKTKIWELRGKLQEHPFCNAILSAHIKTNNTSNPSCNNGISHFHIACIVNNVQAVEFFLKAGIDINQAVNFDSPILPGFTALHFAARFSNFKVAELLLKHGMDVNLKDAKGLTALHLLLKRNMDICDVVNMSRRGPCAQLLTEIQINVSIMKLILNTGDVDYSKLTKLHIVSTFRDNTALDYLLSNDDIDVNTAVKSDDELWPGYTALHFAAHFHLETVIALLQRGANLYVSNAAGKTPLHLLLQRYKAYDIRSILSTQIELRDMLLTDGTTKLLNLVGALAEVDFLRLLFENMGNVNVQVPFDSPVFPGCTPLHLALQMIEKTENIYGFYDNTDYKTDFNNRQDIEVQTCSEQEEQVYSERIDFCLQNGCRIDIQDAKGMTPVHMAFYMQKKSVLRKLFDVSNQGASNNPADFNQVSHLHIAIFQFNRTFIQTYLNDTKVNINLPIKIGSSWVGFDGKHRVRSNSTALHIAVLFCDFDIVELLLNHGADINAKDDYNFTPVHLLMSIYGEKCENIAEMFFSSKQLLMENNVTTAGLSYLHVACSANKKDVVEKLLKQGADPNSMIKLGKNAPEELDFLSAFDGRLPLEIVRMIDEDESDGILMRDLMQVLLENGANLFRIEKNERISLLHKLHDCFDLNTIYIKISKSVHPIDDTGLTLLHVACVRADKDLIEKLLKSGADPNKKISCKSPLWNNFTPLHVLMENASCCHIDINTQVMKDIIQLFVQYNVDLTIQDDHGFTPLHYAIHGDSLRDPNLPIADFLLERQKDYSKNPVSIDGISHFHVACQRNNVAIVKKFIEGGVDINQPTDPFLSTGRGFTPLHFAMIHGRKDVVKVLLENGADVKIGNGCGDTPLYVALEYGKVHLNLIRMLMKKGADILAPNVWGITPFEQLLKTCKLTEKHMEFFLKQGCRANVFNPVSHQGMIALALKAKPAEQKPMEKPAFIALLKASDIASINDQGFNSIHNIVSTPDDSPTHRWDNRVPPENYFEGIAKLVELGCNLDLQNKQGKTPLHIAVDFKNAKAVVALLRMGCDVNITDEHGKTALIYALETCNSLNQQEFSIIMEITACIWKMIFAGMYVTNLNKMAYSKAQGKFEFDENIRISCEEEKEKMKNVKLDSLWTLHHLLSELGCVDECPEISLTQLRTFEEFFKLDNDFLDVNYPQLKSLLRMQYRKALTRLELLQNATDFLKSIQFLLPDLCLRTIFKFLKNHELQDMLKHAEVVPSPPKRLKTC